MTSPRGGRHEYRNASDYRSCLDIARWWWVVREGSLVLTAYVGSTASDDRAAARGGKQFSGYHSTCRSPKPDRQNDLDFQQPGRNNQPTCPRFDVRWTMSSFCNERQLGRLLKKYLAYYRGSGALVCKRTQGVCGPATADGMLASQVAGHHGCVKPDQIGISIFRSQAQPDYAVADGRSGGIASAFPLHRNP